MSPQHTAQCKERKGGTGREKNGGRGRDREGEETRKGQEGKERVGDGEGGRGRILQRVERVFL